MSIIYKAGKEKVRILLFLMVAGIFSACNTNKIILDIPSAFDGYVYIISARGIENKNVVKLDSSGIVYINDYCKGDISLDFIVDSKPISPELSYVESIFANSNANGSAYAVNYEVFYFPFGAKKSYTQKKRSIDELIRVGKVDADKLQSCE